MSNPADTPAPLDPEAAPVPAPRLWPDHPLDTLAMVLRGVLAHEPVATDGNAHGLLTRFQQQLAMLPRYPVPAPVVDDTGDYVEKGPTAGTPPASETANKDTWNSTKNLRPNEKLFTGS